MNRLKYPKVLVAAPTWEGHKYILPKYLLRVKNLSYPNYSVLLVNTGKFKSFTRWLVRKGIKVIKIPYKENIFERITDGRNAIIHYVLQHPDIEYVLSLDTDVIPPRDIIKKLLKHKKKLVGGLVHAGFEKKLPCILKDGYLMKHGRKGLSFYSWDEIKKMKKKKNLHHVYATSVACLLIHRKVFESGVRFRYTPYFNVGEDIWFFNECNEKGFKFYVDVSKRIKHLNKSKRRLMLSLRKSKKR